MSVFVRCSAGACAYNDNWRCEAAVLRIGRDAGCGTYTEGAPRDKLHIEAARELTGFILPAIFCGAVGCRFNRDQVCLAQDVRVVEPTQSPAPPCDTFRPKTEA